MRTAAQHGDPKSESGVMHHHRANSVYSDAGGRITIDIDDAGYSSLSSLFSVTWILGCQYNNSNMPDVRASATTASKSLFVCQLLAENTPRTSCHRAVVGGDCELPPKIRLPMVT